MLCALLLLLAACDAKELISHTIGMAQADAEGGHVLSGSESRIPDSRTK